MAEDYIWRAHLDDHVLDELDDQGVARPFAAIDLSRLKALEIFSQSDPARTYIVPIDGTMRPIFFRRRRIETTMDGTDVGRSTVTCVGWQKTERGRNIQSFLFLFADGSSVMTDDRNAV